MSRKYHLVKLTLPALEEYKSRLYLEVAAVTSEITLRKALAEELPEFGGAREQLVFDTIQTMFEGPDAEE
jgi:hypothetical protein